MSLTVANLNSGLFHKLNTAKRLAPQQFARVVENSLEQGLARADELDLSAKQLKDFAMAQCKEAGALLEKMQAGDVEVSGRKQTLSPAQMEWKGHIQKACYSMFAAGAMEGLQAAKTGLAPRAYSAPRSLSEGASLKTLTDLMDNSRAVDSRGQWVTQRAETSRTDTDPRETTGELLHSQVQERIGSNRDVPCKSQRGGLLYGHVDEMLVAAYDSGTQAGIGWLIAK